MRGFHTISVLQPLTPWAPSEILALMLAICSPFRCMSNCKDSCSRATLFFWYKLLGLSVPSSCCLRSVARSVPAASTTSCCLACCYVVEEPRTKPGMQKSRMEKGVDAIPGRCVSYTSCTAGKTDQEVPGGERERERALAVFVARHMHILIIVKTIGNAPFNNCGYG